MAKEYFLRDGDNTVDVSLIINDDGKVIFALTGCVAEHPLLPLLGREITLRRGKKQPLTKGV